MRPERPRSRPVPGASITNAKVARTDLLRDRRSRPNKHFGGQRRVNNAERSRRLIGMAQTRTPELGPASRPVAVPVDLDDPSHTKATGRVRLPLHIRWSGAPVTYDLDDPVDRARVYEQVLREGTEDDVRFYVAADSLLELWNELVLPPAVREAWAPWIEEHHPAA